MSGPDHAEFQRAAAEYLSTRLQPDSILHVEVKPFEPVSWPPDSGQFTTELFLSVPFLGDQGAIKDALARIGEGFEKNEIDTGSFHVVEFSEGITFNEEHAELGRLRVASVRLTVEPRPATSV